MKRHYSAFVFDLYGTLVDIHTDEAMPALWKAVSAFFDVRGMTCSPAALRDLYSHYCVLRQKQKELSLAASGIPGPAEIEITDVWADMAAELKGGLSFEERLELSAIFRKTSIKKLRLYPGAAELLRALRRAGKTVCLLTNAQVSFTQAELDQMGLTDLFDHRFFSGSAGVKKPSPAFFALLWAEGLCPETSLMIGNDDICDCKGASAAGMDSLYIRTEQSPVPSGPLSVNTTEIHSLSEVLKYI